MDNDNDTTGDDTVTRHSSKLSLGSSPSVLSGDEEDGDSQVLKNDPSDNYNNNNNGDECLSTTTLQEMDGGCSGADEQDKEHHVDQNTDEKDKAGSDKQGDNNDMDNLFDGSLLASSSDNLDDINLEHDSVSPLSSVPDDFPLSPETQDGSLSSPPPTHKSISSDSPPSAIPFHQKQQLQAETPPPRESGSGNNDMDSQDDMTTTLNSSSSSSNRTRKRKRRTRNKGGQYQSSNQNISLSTNNDGNDTNGQSASQQSVKSRRISIHGRAIHTKSPLNTKNDTHAKQEDDNDNDSGNEDNKMDEMTKDSSKQIPLAPAKQHNTTETPKPLAISKKSTTQQQSGFKDINNVQPDTDDSSNNEEKENTPVISNQENGGTTNRNDFAGSIYTNPLENPEMLPINEEDDRDDEQQHKEAFDALTHIEVEFARLRDKLYQEKMAELNDEALMIANGTHPNLVTLMMEIEEKKGRRINTAKAWRKYQHDNFKRQFEGSEYQANVHFISRKSSMRRKILAEMNGKRWRLQDEQGKLNDPSHKNGNILLDTNTLTTRKQSKRHETTDLQDINDVIGFPRAPQTTKLSRQDIRDDMLLLGLGASGSH